MLTAKGDMLASKRFLDDAMGANGDLDRVAMDQSGANKAAIDAIDAGADFDTPSHVPQQHRRAGRSRHRARDRSDAQLQIFPVCLLGTCRQRCDAHDPETPVRCWPSRPHVLRRPFLYVSRTGPFVVSGGHAQHEISPCWVQQRDSPPLLHGWCRFLNFAPSSAAEPLSFCIGGIQCRPVTLPAFDTAQRPACAALYLTR